jgi:hypothetical protein
MHRGEWDRIKLMPGNVDWWLCLENVEGGDQMNWLLISTFFLLFQCCIEHFYFEFGHSIDNNHFMAPSTMNLWDFIENIIYCVRWAIFEFLHIYQRAHCRTCCWKCLRSAAMIIFWFFIDFFALLVWGIC